MKSKKEIEIFRVPIRYFDEFEHRLFNKLHEEMLPKKTGFKTPETYFFNLDIKLKREHSKASTKKKIVPVISFKTFSYAASIASVAILFFSILETSNPEHNIKEIEISNIENFINEENIQLNQYELAYLFTEEKLNNMTNDVTLLPENQLEDYLLESINDSNPLLEY